MDLRRQLLIWIGAFGGGLGMISLSVAPIDDLLPINQILFALDISLIVIWALVYAAQIWGERP